MKNLYFILPALAMLGSVAGLRGEELEETELSIQNAVRIAFEGKLGSTYRVYSSSDADSWMPVAEPVKGAGGEITFFVTTESDRHVFYKVEELQNGLTLLPDFDSVANLWQPSLRERNFRGVDFSGMDLRFADFAGSDLRNANFTGADLRNSHLITVTTGAVFDSADMRNSDNLYIAEASLRNVLLDGAQVWLRDCDLTGASLVGTTLNRGETTVFNSANFLEASLGGNFSEANFSRADFQNASISGDFLMADFSNANFLNATFSGTVNLSNANLTGATNFDTVEVTGNVIFNETIMPDGSIRTDP